MLEDQIKELETQLEFKKALLSVAVSFGKGNKFSEETKTKITELIKKFCQDQADGKTQTDGFTEQELTILKQVAAKVIQKAEAPSQKQTGSPSKPEPQRSQSQLRATIMLLDNVDPSVRNKISPLSIVTIVGKMNNEVALVETEQGVRFHVPIDDLDFEINK